MITHHCVGFIAKRFADGRMRILSVTDWRFPFNVKAPGGSNKSYFWKDLNYSRESPTETLKRKFWEKTKVTVFDALSFFKEESKNNQGVIDHVKISFWIGTVEKESLPKINETRMDKLRGLSVRWILIEEFAHKLFFNQRPAFKKFVLEILAHDPKDPEFSDNYKNLIELVKSPDYLGKSPGDFWSDALGWIKKSFKSMVNSSVRY